MKQFAYENILRIDKEFKPTLTFLVFDYVLKFIEIHIYHALFSLELSQFALYLQKSLYYMQFIPIGKTYLR